jgi:glycosyltransferase involved in cell wall biosynthesis
VEHGELPGESRNRGSTQGVRDSAWPIGGAPELVAGTPGHEAALDTPMFSILMPSMGDRPSLRVAVDALLAQDYERWELVLKVVDADAARRQLPQDDRIVVLEGPDRNLTHAVNLAMEHARGDVFNWANDDDVLLPGALAYVAEHLREAMWLRAPVDLLDEDGQRLGRSGDLPWDLVAQKTVSRVAQPGVFWRREAVASIGNLDESVALASDYDYFTRLGERWEPRSVDRVVAEYRLGGDVLTLTQQHVQNPQVARIRARSAYAELAKRDAEIEALRAERDSLRRTVREMRQAASWRLTAPARRLRRMTHRGAEGDG